MTRRERHLKIVSGFDDRTVRYAFVCLQARHGFNLLSDEAVEMLAREVLAIHKRRQETNARNRALSEERRVAVPI